VKYKQPEVPMKGIVFIALITVIAAWGTEEVVLEADADSFVRYFDELGGEIQYADDNYGGESYMRVLDNVDQFGHWIEIAYMHFDFSGLDYDGEYLIGAQLVFRSEYSAYGEQRAYKVNGAWEEMTITYDNRPGAGAFLASFYISAGYNYVNLDTTPIAPWVDAPETAHGIMIVDAEQVMEHDDPAKIDTRETGNGPELWLTFSGPAVEETSWGEIKAAFE
jgi:hypothetical protein